MIVLLRDILETGCFKLLDHIGRYLGEDFGGQVRRLICVAKRRVDGFVNAARLLGLRVPLVIIMIIWILTWGRRCGRHYLELRWLMPCGGLTVI